MGRFLPSLSHLRMKKKNTEFAKLSSKKSKYKRKRFPLSPLDLRGKKKSYKSPDISRLFTPSSQRYYRLMRRNDNKEINLETEYLMSYKPKEEPTDLGKRLEDCLVDIFSCIRCGCKINKYDANTPIYDFYCECGAKYQLKSSQTDFYFTDKYITTGSREKGKNIIGVKTDINDQPIFICVRLTYNENKQEYKIVIKQSYILCPKDTSSDMTHYNYLDTKSGKISWNLDLVDRYLLSDHIDINIFEKKINI